MSLDSQTLDKSSQNDLIIGSLPQVEAVLNYLAPMAEKPVYYIGELPPDTIRDNAFYETRTLPIRNARSLTRNLSLDLEGFTLVEQNSAVKDFYNEDEVRHIYYPEIEQFLKNVTGSAKAIVFDHNLRNSQQAKQGKHGIQEPVSRVHNDFTAKSGYSRARIVLNEMGIDDPEALLKHRFSIVNIWRPIAEPVQESPLAVCNAQSIAPTDLVTRDLIYRDRVGETYSVTYNPAHQWFYFPQMQRNEVLLIKCFDSADDGRARFTAHTAFNDPTSPANAPSRESIELRSLVFYPV